ncbi:MAG: hypothetical protein R3B45_12140 [Bdellovibrionota bacterium]
MLVSLLRSGLALGAALFSLLSFADIESDFNKLKSHPQDYTTFGTICEEVARVRLQERYGTDNYEFKVGIAYTGHGRTLGELDVTVFRKGDHKAIVVAEVKCWRKLHQGLMKAKKQLQRFQKNIALESIESMVSTGPEAQTFKPSQFDESPTFLTISQKGGIKAGFDLDIGLDIDEVKNLRAMLIRCQEHGNCPRK